MTVIVHIEHDIFIKSNGLGYDICKKSVRDVKDKDTKEVTKEDYYVPEKHYTSLTGAVNGLMNHYIQRFPDTVIFELNQLTALIQKHREYIESKLGGF